MTENEKARELIATSETTVKVDPQNGWYLKRFAALQFEGSVDNFGTNMPIHVLEQQLPKEDTVKLDDAVIEGQEIDYSRFYDEKGNEYSSVSELVQTRLSLDDDDAIQEYNKENPKIVAESCERHSMRVCPLRRADLLGLPIFSFWRYILCIIRKSGIRRSISLPR